MNTYSLFELNEYLRRVVALNFQEAMWVRCEIAQLSISRGHYYLNLVEQEDTIVAKANAVLWARDFRRLQRKVGVGINNILQEGMSVLIKLRVEFHELYGMQYLVEDLDLNYTLGKLETQRKAMIESLRKKGLLEKNAQIPLPLVLQRIAVITSPTAAGYQDYLKQLAANPYGYFFENQLFATAMQGILVEKEILNQLKKIKSQQHFFDAVVIIRGGGAKLDLLAFDNEKIGEAVAKFPLPIITGIGHDIDETVLDVVAHSALKTPTAVADFLIHHNLFFENKLLELSGLLENVVHEKLQDQVYLLKNAQQIIQIHARSSIRSASQMLQFIEKEFPKYLNYFLKKEKENLKHLEDLYQILSPEKTLERGFTLTTKDGKIITSKKQIEVDEEIITHFKDGKRKSIVKK